MARKPPSKPAADQEAAPAATPAPAKGAVKPKAGKKAKPRKPIKPKRPRGRPTLYTPRLAEKILDLLAAGHNMTDICSRAGMPSDRVVRAWEKGWTTTPPVPGFASAIALAREAWLDALDHKMMTAIQDDTKWEDVEEEVRQQNASGRSVTRRVHRRRVDQTKIFIHRLEQTQRRYLGQLGLKGSGAAAGEDDDNGTEHHVTITGGLPDE